jgi:hypothetical protein
MKYLILAMIFTGCASSQKKGCTITQIMCPENPKSSTKCTLIFDDDSYFFIPYSGAKLLKVNTSICRK